MGKLDELFKKRARVIEEIESSKPEVKIGAIDAEIQSAKAAERAQVERERSAQIERQREQARAMLVDVIAKMRELQSALDALAVLERALGKLYAPIGLRQVIADAFRVWGFLDPVLVGNPPNPTAQEARRAEIASQIKRLESVLSEMQNAREHMPPAESSESARMREDETQAEIRRLRAKLGTL